MKTNRIKKAAVSATLALGTLAAVQAQDPAVVVTIENTAPYNGTFLTPVWVGFHNGQFDTYDRGALANTLPVPGSVALERLAEDGNTGPITSDFDTLVPLGAQGTITSNGPIPPIGPSQIVSRLFPVDPDQTRYFSYASMVIPSNDAFIANGNPLAHPVFDENGNFIGGEPFYVPGSSVLDAGTEVNDEVPANTAFFGQAAPNTGVVENQPILTHPGFNAVGSGGILDSPRFSDADFTEANATMVRFKLTLIDRDAPVLFAADLATTFESPAPTVTGNPTGSAFFFLDQASGNLNYFVFANGLSGDLTAAHIHLAPLTQNGPVTVPLQIAFGRFAFGSISAADVTGPLGNTSAPLDSLIAELTAGSAYVNLHTAANPAGELRGQVHLNR